jgi:hypothetical protein
MRFKSGNKIRRKPKKMVPKPKNCLTSNELAARWGRNPQSIRSARYLGFNHPKWFYIGWNVYYKYSDIINFERQEQKNGTKIIK